MYGGADNQLLIYETENGVIEVRLKENTVWLSLQQISALFARDKSVISRHLKKNMKPMSWRGKQLLQKKQQFRWKGRAMWSGMSISIVWMPFCPSVIV